MAKPDGIYKCEICGNVVSVIIAREGDLVCCDQPMKLMPELTSAKEGKEKHVPMIEPAKDGVRVTVGSVMHPMEEKHYVTIIQLLKDGKVLFSKRLEPGQEPVAEFCIEYSPELSAREYCNIHGLWKS